MRLGRAWHCLLRELLKPATPVGACSPSGLLARGAVNLGLLFLVLLLYGRQLGRLLGWHG